MKLADRETLTTAFGNLGRHKLRTSLTMLGMVFGVGAVIAMLSIGAGAEKKALEAIGRLGLRNVIVQAKEIKPDDRQEIRKKSLGVSLRDGEAISEAVPNIERVVPRVEVRSEEHTSELQSRLHLVCRLLLEKKKKKNKNQQHESKSRSIRIYH